MEIPLSKELNEKVELALKEYENWLLDKDIQFSAIDTGEEIIIEKPFGQLIYSKKRLLTNPITYFAINEVSHKIHTVCANGIPKTIHEWIYHTQKYNSKLRTGLELSSPTNNLLIRKTRILIEALHIPTINPRKHYEKEVKRNAERAEITEKFSEMIKRGINILESAVAENPKIGKKFVKSVDAMTVMAKDISYNYHVISNAHKNLSNAYQEYVEILWPGNI